MAHQDLFKFLPGDERTKQLLSQPGHQKWIEALEEKLKPILVTRGQMLTVAGKKPDAIYYLERGAIKGYRHKFVKQQVFYLWDSQSIVGDARSFFDEKPSDLYIQVVKDASLLMLEKEALNSVISEFPESWVFLTSIVLHCYSYHEENHFDMLELNSFERFEKLISTRKMIDMTFSKSDIASLLGVSRSSLNTFYHKGSR
ncbi:Crp/Fnr family transcriptional regulator [Pedobacter sp. L105]|uniref:Crp/Fnr family transcriptional regulator n=1 Tax=Pedobacter sp. L105 TaxID=1641871 RepID=UPI00131D89D0|nr:Crp/Fnr family transcriptional regulator [Pedobacter sp. L105]